MKRSYLRRHTPVFVALLLVASQAASAQEQERAPTVDLRGRWGGQIGGVAYTTGAGQNCPKGGGITFGAEARTRGVWFGAVGVDLFYAGPDLCETVLRGARYRGEPVSLVGSSRFSGTLRPRIRLGRTVTIGSVHVEPAFNVGMTHSAGAVGYPPERVWNAWVGGSVTLRPSDVPWGLEVEYGVHQVRQRYQAWPSGEVLREFNRWKPLFRFSLVR